MFPLIDANKIPTNFVVVGLLIVLIIFSLWNMWQQKKNSKEGLESRNPALPYVNDIKYAQIMSDRGSKEQFSGRPEPPVFYPIGSAKMVGSGRQNVTQEAFRPVAVDWAASRREKFSDTELMKTMY